MQEVANMYALSAITKDQVFEYLGYYPEESRKFMRRVKKINRDYRRWLERQYKKNNR